MADNGTTTETPDLLSYISECLLLIQILLVLFSLPLFYCLLGGYVHPICRNYSFAEFLALMRACRKR